MPASLEETLDQTLLWAGIDTASRTHAICVVDASGRVVREAVLPAEMSTVVEFLADPKSLVGVALESGTVSLHPARSLEALGYKVFVFNAGQAQRFIRLIVNKTDINDARGLAEIARLHNGRLTPVFMRCRELAVLRMKLVTRERITKTRKVNENALMSILHAHGVRAFEKVSSQTSLNRVVGQMLEKAAPIYGHSVGELVKPLVDLSALLRSTELKIEGELKAYASQNDLCQRLMEILGVGIITAISFITAIADPSRFLRSSDVGPYLGLTPKIWETGEYSRKRGISKHGSSLTRRHLHLAARSMMRSRFDSDLLRWAKGLEARMCRKKAVTALSRKLAVVMLTMWKEGTRFRFEQPSPV